MKKRPVISVDAMGGDNAPHAILEGCIEACRARNVEIHLVGKTEILKSQLAQYDASQFPLHIAHASQVVHMHDNPLDVVKKDNDSSIRVGINLVKTGKAHAFVSAGNSGAVLAGSLFLLKRIKGIDRPAIATVMPTYSGNVIVADAGANNTCKPYNIVQFAIMCSVYSKYFLKCKNPRVAVLSNGEEETKGTDIVKHANDLLKESSINYIGYIEGKDVFKGGADVVSCDGFSGNILLKTAEGVAESIGSAIKEELQRTIMAKTGYLFARNAFKRLKKRFDYSEYGGAPLLGVNGGVIIGHGRSNANAIKNAVFAACDFVDSNVIEHIKNDLEVNRDLQSIGRKPSFIERVFK